jgi:hypothetical protein
VEPTATITFIDRFTEDEGHAIIRETDAVIALVLSLKKDGDIEVGLDAATCGQLIEALTEAKDRATR